MYSFLYPVKINSRVSQLFGARPAFYKPLGFLGHPGIDFAIPTGSEVRASNWGKVIKVGNDPNGWGEYVKIDHGNFITLYAHLSSPAVSENCFITRGQIVGWGGSTGNSTGPHLHFGILNPKQMNNGYKGYINPMILLSKTETDNHNKLVKIEREIAQIKKDRYSKDSMYIHTTYIDRILRGEK